MFSLLSIAGLAARARQLLSGPAAAALAFTLVATVVVGSAALGIAWLRGDAARDAAAAVQAVCDADKLRVELEATRARAAALEAAQRQRDATIAHLTEQRSLDAAVLAELEQERANAIDDARKWEDAAGRRDGAVFRADDPWLRKGRSAANSAPAAAGR